MKYFVCGFSGAGKSEFLKKLKDSKSYPEYVFVDLDRSILSSHGKGFGSLGELIQAKGWQWFRQTEREELFTLLKSPNIWIALGGGTLTSEVADILVKREDVKGFWIDTDFEICWKRIQNDKNRPLVQKGKKELRYLYNERLSQYQRFERLIL